MYLQIRYLLLILQVQSVSVTTKYKVRQKTLAFCFLNQHQQKPLLVKRTRDRYINTFCIQFPFLLKFYNHFANQNQQSLFPRMGQCFITQTQDSQIVGPYPLQIQQCRFFLHIGCTISPVGNHILHDIANETAIKFLMYATLP